MKILWANRYCLLDTSSGASRSAREILRMLASLGCEVRVVGATVFDHPIGITGLGAAWERVQSSDKRVARVNDGELTHQLVRTGDTASAKMTLEEMNALYALYRANLKEFEPDIVFFYGGNSFDMLIPIEAKRHGATTCAYLVNANYKGDRWYDDVDLIFTDSSATAQLYKDEVGIDVIPIGKFIDPAGVVAADRNPERVTFINPSIEKGGALVAQIALAMEKSHPDIPFEVVESRGSWATMLNAVQTSKRKRASLKNVVVTPNTSDMRPVYARSRVLLVPSLWWESGARVLAEATLNGIPVIATDRGGNAEMLGDSGVKLKVPDTFYQPPYTQLLGPEGVAAVSKIIERFYDDADYYRQSSEDARAAGRLLHNGRQNARALHRLLRAVTTLKKKDTDPGVGARPPAELPAPPAAPSTRAPRYGPEGPRVCVVTLARGEPQLEANRRAVAAQDYPVSMHHVIENLEPEEAERQFCRLMTDHSDRYDIFVWVPNGTVPKYPKLLSGISSAFQDNPSLDFLVVPHLGSPEKTSHGPVHAFSQRVTWEWSGVEYEGQPTPKLTGYQADCASPEALQKGQLRRLPLTYPYQSYAVADAAVTLIHPPDNWILTKMASVLNASIKNSIAIDYRQIDRDDIRQRMNTKGNINYYIHYNFFQAPSKGIDVAWFTHIEDNPALKRRFYEVYDSVDYAIFNSTKYFNELGADAAKGTVIIPGIDDQYFSRKLVLGISGRHYDYTERKNKPLMDYIANLPYVELVFTDGKLDEREMVNFYRTIDYVLVCSTIEGGPMSVLEGMASGKQTIMPRGVGLQEDFSECVLSYDLENKNSLVGLLQKLFFRKAKILSEVEKFTWSFYTKNHANLFKQLAQRNIS